MRPFDIRANLETAYPDVLTPQTLDALQALAPLDDDRKTVMAARTARRLARARDRQRMTFLDPEGYIPCTQLTVQDARQGRFVGSAIPADLTRQWIQGTGPAAKPNAPVEKSI